MSKELPTVSANQAIKVFEAFDFYVCRVTGSHHIMKKDNHHNRLSIPKHGNKPLKPGLLKAQINKAGITVEKFKEKL